MTCIPTISLLDLISTIYIFLKDCLPSHDNWKGKRGQDQNHLSFLLRKASYLLADKFGDQLHSCSCLVEKMSSINATIMTQIGIFPSAQFSFFFNFFWHAILELWDNYLVCVMEEYLAIDVDFTVQLFPLFSILISSNIFLHIQVHLIKHQISLKKMLTSSALNVHL